MLQLCNTTFELATKLFSFHAVKNLSRISSLEAIVSSLSPFQSNRTASKLSRADISTRTLQQATVITRSIPTNMHHLIRDPPGCPQCKSTPCRCCNRCNDSPCKCVRYAVRFKHAAHETGKPGSEDWSTCVRCKHTPCHCCSYCRAFPCRCWRT